MKPYSIVVTGEPTYIKSLINSISFDPEKLITHNYSVKGSDEKKSVRINFGSLQVDEDHRLDFFGGNDEGLFEFIDGRPNNGFKGIIIILNADDSKALKKFKESLAKHADYLFKHAMVVGVSGNEYTAIKQAEEEVRKSLKDLSAVAPIFSIDPSNKEEVSLLVESLLCLSSPGIVDNSRGKSSFESGN